MEENEQSLHSRQFTVLNYSWSLLLNAHFIASAQYIFIELIKVSQKLEAILSKGLGHVGFSSCGHMGSEVAAPGRQSTGSVVVEHRLSCSTAWGIVLDQGSNLHLLHWQVDSLLLSDQESPDPGFLEFGLRGGSLLKDFHSEKFMFGCLSTL